MNSIIKNNKEYINSNFCLLKWLKRVKNNTMISDRQNSIIKLYIMFIQKKKKKKIYIYIYIYISRSC